MTVPVKVPVRVTPAWVDLLVSLSGAVALPVLGLLTAHGVITSADSAAYGGIVGAALAVYHGTVYYANRAGQVVTAASPAVPPVPAAAVGTPANPATVVDALPATAGTVAAAPAAAAGATGIAAPVAQSGVPAGGPGWLAQPGRPVSPDA